MEKQSRNNSVAGIVMLAGVALIAFGATQPWSRIGVSIPWGPFAGFSPGHSLGFDNLPASGGSSFDGESLIIGLAVCLGILALALIATRVRGLGMLWRLLALVGIIFLGLIVGSLWALINDPVSALTEDSDSLGATFAHGLETAARDAGVASFDPQLGLWLVTIGIGVAAIGALIPAIRRTTYQPVPQSGPYSSVGNSQPPVPTAPAGWFPDPHDPTVLRWFDGRGWTGAVRPRL